jgi:hypothetical protein
MILALLLALQVQAAVLVEKWSVTIKDGSPVAAFFDAGSGSVFVSVSEGKQARLDRFDLTGKLLKQGIAEAEGRAGPMRAHFGKIYWTAGFTIWSLDPITEKKGKVKNIAEGTGDITDFTVARDGTIYVSLSKGMLLETNKESSQVRAEGEPITGLFLLDTELYMVKTHQLQAYSLTTQKLGAKKNFCHSDCLGLEKASSGSWITAEGNKLREIKEKANRVLLDAKEPLGRLGYIYDREPKEDMVIIPFPASKTLRAYRFQ